MGLSFYLPAQSPKRVELRNGLSTCCRPRSPGAAWRPLSTFLGGSQLDGICRSWRQSPLDGFDPHNTRPSPPNIFRLLLTLMKVQQLMSTTFFKNVTHAILGQGSLLEISKPLEDPSSFLSPVYFFCYENGPGQHTNAGRGRGKGGRKEYILLHALLRDDRGHRWSWWSFPFDKCKAFIPALDDKTNHVDLRISRDFVPAAGCLATQSRLWESFLPLGRTGTAVY